MRCARTTRHNVLLIRKGPRNAFGLQKLDLPRCYLSHYTCLPWIHYIIHIVEYYVEKFDCEGGVLSSDTMI